MSDSNVVSFSSTNIIEFSISGQGVTTMTETLGPYSALSTSLDSSNNVNVYTFALNTGLGGIGNKYVDYFNLKLIQGTQADSLGYMYYITCPVDIAYASNLSLSMSGTVKSSIYVTGPSDESIVCYPQRMYIYFDDVSTGYRFDFDVNNEVFLDAVSFSIPETGIKNISFGFFISPFDKKQSVDLGIVNDFSYTFGANFVDGLALNLEETPFYVPMLDKINNTLETLPERINDVLFGSVDPDIGAVLNDEMLSKLEEANKIQQEIEEGLEKPDPEEIVPDITVIVDQTDPHYVQYMDILSDLLSNSMITNLLLLVVSMAFVSYVLFGKKG